MADFSGQYGGKIRSLREKAAPPSSFPFLKAFFALINTIIFVFFRRNIIIFLGLA
jgi:hypothetical protein